MESSEPAPAPLTASEAPIHVTDVELPPLTEEGKCIRIVPGGRYAVIVPDGTPETEVHQLANALQGWYESGNPFLIMWKVKLVRVDEEQEDDSAHRG